MARTIRTKVYQFSELSESAKVKAMKDEVRKFHSCFNVDEMNIRPSNLRAAKERILRYEYEFKADGTRF